MRVLSEIIRYNYNEPGFWALIVLNVLAWEALL